MEGGVDAGRPLNSPPREWQLGAGALVSSDGTLHGVRVRATVFAEKST